MITQEEMMRMIMLMNPELYQMMQLMGPIQTMSAEEAIRMERRLHPKKKTTAYQRRYKKAFKKIQSRYKLKSGKWKKNGFKLAVKEAHRIAKKGNKK